MTFFTPQPEEMTMSPTLSPLSSSTHWPVALMVDFGPVLDAEPNGRARDLRVKNRKKKVRKIVHQTIDSAGGVVVRDERQTIVAEFHGAESPAVTAVTTAARLRDDIPDGGLLRVGLLPIDGPEGPSATPRRLKAATALNQHGIASEIRVLEPIEQAIRGAAITRPVAESVPIDGANEPVRVYSVHHSGAGSEPPAPARRPSLAALRPQTGGGSDHRLETLQATAAALFWAVLQHDRKPPELHRDKRPGDRLLRAARAWNTASPVTGFGVGPKGPNPDGVLALKIFVKHKVPGRSLPRTAVIPKQLDIPGGESVITDVEEVGEVVAQYQTRQRPAFGGSCVGHYLLAGGSIGCLVRDHSGTLYVLSAAHVLADSNATIRGADILQRCNTFNKSGPKEILTGFHRQVPLLPIPAVNVVDAAIAGPVTVGDCSGALGRGGPLPLSPVSATLGMGVFLHGAGSNGRTGGTVRAVGVFQRVTIPGRCPYDFSGLVLCSPYTTGGDSGALVTDPADHAVGLHMAGSPKASFFCPIKTVTNALGVDLVTADTP